MRPFKTISLLGATCGTLFVAAPARAQFPVSITAPAALNTNAAGDSENDLAEQRHPTRYDYS